MAWAVRQKLPCTQKIVLMMLAERHNKDTGQCNPSHDLLADDCGLTRRSVMDQVAKLAEAGYLRIRHRAANNVKLPNQYILMFSFGVQEEVKDFSEVVNDVHQGSATRSKGSEQRSLGVVNHVPVVVNHVHQGSEPRSHKPGIEPGIEPKEKGSAGAQDGFAPPSMTGAICMVMKASGMGVVNPNHPDLKVLIDKGADVGLFAEVARECAAKGKPFAYALAVVKGRMADAAALATTAMSLPLAKQQAPQAESFAERDARIGRENWERMTGRQWPTEDLPSHLQPQKPAPLVIDINAPRRIA